MNRDLNSSPSFFKGALPVDKLSVWLWALMSLSVCSVTAFLQWQIAKPLSFSSSAQYAQNALPCEPVEGALRDYLRARQESLQRKKISRELPSDSGFDQSIQSTPPAVFIKGVVISGIKKFALLAIDGAAQYLVAQEGDIIAEMLKVAEINSRGVTFCWRGGNFFVPLE